MDLTWRCISRCFLSVCLLLSLTLLVSVSYECLCWLLLALLFNDECSVNTILCWKVIVEIATY